MAIGAQYRHTNLIAADWRTLARFYEDLFGCVRVPPERDLSGPDMERGTGVENARLTGVHLRLPGWGESGPTLEIFSYGLNDVLAPGMPNRTGYGHLAFSVPDVAAARDAVVAAGGSEHGAIVTTRAGDKAITWVYVRDPEGNLVELQSVSTAKT
ncbi:MAG TPA: VOC family protein [Candidatus Didemnitutus sp.]|jgi:catechol 2,3-dioxygenase-like lactoylglutathione lyase family enzyme